MFSEKRRRRGTPRCTRRRARLGLFAACITAVVLVSRSFFLGGVSRGGSGGSGVFASVQNAADGLLRFTSHSKDATSLPLFDALVVYDAEDSAAAMPGKMMTDDQGGPRALTSEAAVAARGGVVPILVVAGCRPRMLRRALLSLLSCIGVTPGLLLVSVDEQPACGGAAARVAQEFGVRSVSRQNQQYFESGSKRIARHYKWSLHRAFEVLEPRAPAVVVVEEDLLFSVDFYTYMLSSLESIQGGSSCDSSNNDDHADCPWTASGWNDNGYAGRVRDPAAVRLTSFFPGLGWILTRKIWDKVLGPAWPDDHWDHWMREQSAIRSRSVIIPEVNRVFHAGVDGIFMNTHMHMKLFHYIAPYGGATGITFDMSSVVTSTEYRRQLIQRMAAATPLSSAEQLFHQAHATTISNAMHLAIENPRLPPGENDVVMWVKGGEISTWCKYFGLWPLSDASGLRSAFSGVIEFYWDQPTAAIKDDETVRSGGNSNGAHIYLVKVSSNIASDVAHASRRHALAISKPLDAAPLRSPDGRAARAREASSRFDWPSDGGYHRVRGYVRPHIPRIMHQTWKTADESQWSSTMKASVSSWRDMNPSYEMKFWDDKAAADFVSEHFPKYVEVYGKSPVIQKADLFRYLVLLKEGGVYADTDVLCRVPIDLWPSVDYMRTKVTHKPWRLQGKVRPNDESIALGTSHLLSPPSHPLRLLIGIEFDDYNTELKPAGDAHGGTVNSPCRARGSFSQWAMASAPWHPAMRRVAESVKTRINSKYNTLLLDKWKRTGDPHAVTAETVFTTGPCVWTEAISAWLKETHGLDWRTLRGEGLDHVVGDVEIFGGKAIYDELVEHRFAGSWKK